MSGNNVKKVSVANPCLNESPTTDRTVGVLEKRTQLQEEIGRLQYMLKETEHEILMDLIDNREFEFLSVNWALLARLTGIRQYKP